MDIAVNAINYGELIQAFVNILLAATGFCAAFAVIIKDYPKRLRHLFFFGLCPVLIATGIGVSLSVYKIQLAPVFMAVSFSVFIVGLVIFSCLFWKDLKTETKLHDRHERVTVKSYPRYAETVKKVAKICQYCGQRIDKRKKTEVKKRKKLAKAIGKIHRK